MFLFKCQKARILNSLKIQNIQLIFQVVILLIIVHLIQNLQVYDLLLIIQLYKNVQ